MSARPEYPRDISSDQLMVRVTGESTYAEPFERFTVNLLLDEDNLAPGRIVASARCLRISPYHQDKLAIVDVLTGMGNDLAAFAALFATNGEWRSDLDGVLVGTEADLLVVTHVEVAPAWRRRRLGALVLATTVARLGAGCRAAACFPAPLPSEENDDSDVLAREVAELTELAVAAGFTPWRYGIALADLARRGVQEAYEALLAAAGHQAGEDPRSDGPAGDGVATDGSR